MAVAPLQIPAYPTPQAVDFSPLERLGQNLRKSREDDLRRQAVQQYAATGDARGLFASGDMSLAQLGAQLESRKEAQTRDARDFQFRQDESRRTQSNADRTYQLQAQSSGGRDIAQQVEQRKRAASGFGLDPSHPSYQSYVLTGKMPREDAQPLTATDKKAILEADEGVLSAETAIEGLKKAKELSPGSFEGPLASQRGYGASLIGNQGGENTVELQNLITSNALTQLKSIFGGMPTEGERKILLEVQGSVNQPDAVRQKIYDRAIALANRRLQFNKQRAESMRGGSFYRGQSQPRPENNAGDPLAQARNAIDQGADRNAVIQRLRENGIDPSGL